ncbi:MAG TPA: hypothetical protein PK868_12020 [Phycicoccus sp.]|jgi:hypothetical protein|nr:hypothetical protein [Phycicoccus sp.]HQH08747.1 hypothetical protein [Phycicoccus sp.]HQK32969.1 hypothetical protein [Phycicoccus sp.]HRA46426.1 hypothetical protein [Phycicoccus sp.]
MTTPGSAYSAGFGSQGPPWRPKSCSWCGEQQFEAGFIEDTGQSSQGAARWIPGALERGFFGGAVRFGKERIDIQGFRCIVCGHLELFAPGTRPEDQSRGVGT